MTFPGFGPSPEAVFAPADDISARAMRIAGWQTQQINLVESLIVNTSEEQDLYSYNVVGGTLGTKAVIMVIMDHFFLNNSGSTFTLTFRVRFGSEVAASVADSITSNAAWRWARAVLLLKANGLTNSQLVRFGNSAETTDTVVATFGRDSTVDQLLRITAQWSAAHANAQFMTTMRRSYLMRTVP